MIISKVLDEPNCDEGRAAVDGGDHAEYQTASQLFDLMTKDTHFDINNDDSLTSLDLVLLYKNIDIGTKLMNDATGQKFRKPNQYVETIVYDEPESDSETSDIYSADDIQNIFMVNQERLDFLNDKSLENLLGPKFGGIEIKSSDVSTNYNSNFLFKDPYIKSQLKNLNVMTSSCDFDSIFSTSLIDYICCKRLEDNYNFYMNNIIRYVQNTIEQLKRISNGDYLTERAKEKWREVNPDDDQQNNDTKILATSTSIPLHVECKRTGNVSWDEIVHSEVDIRSLSKILEKKIIVEIPKLICGSYRLYSKQCSDNLIVSCQREQQKFDDRQASRVDVELQLKRSETGQVISNIKSIMILRTSPRSPDLHAKRILSIAYKNETNEKYSSNKEDTKNIKMRDLHAKRILSVPYGIKDEANKICSTNKEDTKNIIIKPRVLDVRAAEILPIIKKEESNEDFSTNHTTKAKVTFSHFTRNTDVVLTELETLSEQEAVQYQDLQNDTSCIDTDYNSFTNLNIACEVASNQNWSESSSALRDTKDIPVFPVNNSEIVYTLTSADELRMTTKRNNSQGLVLDENFGNLIPQFISKRKSPVRIRIKSPYENKSFLLEQKKRKRLLEMREKKKMACIENYKITKYKCVKGPIMPQGSTSITKLSITNKSFYNSIYGQNLNLENKPKHKPKINNILNPEISSPMKEIQEEYFESPMLTPDKNSQKYCNRSYYLDDAETEMMYTQVNLEDENKDVQHPSSVSDSCVSNVFNEHLDLLHDLMGPSDITICNNQAYSIDNTPQSFTESPCCGEQSLSVLDITNSTVPINFVNNTQPTSKKISSSDECRKSIDQLYVLIKQFDKPNISADSEISKSKAVANIKTGEGDRFTSTIQGSESNTSVKHVISSNHSGNSTEKNATTTAKYKNNKNQTAVVPKVITNSMSRSPNKAEKMKKESKRPIVSSPPGHPLKAISHLLHEFENVQKIRQKSVTDGKLPKKTEAMPIDVKSNNRQVSFNKGRSRFEQHFKSYDQEKKVHPASITPKEKRAKPVTLVEITRNPHQPSPLKDKHFEKAPKKIGDIIDEAKEARGEAVRGPSKFNSRLNNLAQPKKCYVQAHHREYENRYGKNMVAERLQKLAGSQAPLLERNSMISSPRNKSRKNGTEATSAALVKHPAPLGAHLDKEAKWSRSSASNSPDSDVRFACAPHKLDLPPDFPTTTGSKKIVAAESHVKSNYGRPITPIVDKLLPVHRPRAPSFLHDLKLASISCPRAEKTTGLSRDPPAIKLALVTECNESPFTNLFMDISESLRSVGPRSESDFCLDVLEDVNLETAVGNITLVQTKKSTSAFSQSTESDLRPLNSTMELELLESALYSQLSGTFPKRLRLKTLTLTPKHSMQQVFLLQSGDEGSVRVNSKMSKSNLKLNKCSRTSLQDLQAMPVLSNSCLDWSFAQIPMQISTVGYVFPEQHISQKSSNSTGIFLKMSSQSSPCFKAKDQKPLTDTGAQMSLAEELAADFLTVSVENLDDHIKPTNTQMLVDIEHVEISNGTHLNSLTVHEIEHYDDKESSKIVDVLLDDDVKEEEMKVTSESNDCVRAPDYTNSLDVLVTLLNEIQKITYQNQVGAVKNYPQCTNLETILNKAKAFEKASKNTASDIVSITSLENLRQLESNSSVYSLYVSNVDSASENNVNPVANYESKVIQTLNDVSANKDFITENLAMEATKPTGVDKEVTANLCQNYVDTSIDVQSSLSHITFSLCTDVTNYAIGVISKPSTPNIQCLLDSSSDYNSPLLDIDLSDYQTLYSNTLFRNSSVKNIVELPQIEINEREQISQDTTDLNETCFDASFLSIRCNEAKQEKRVVHNDFKKYCVKNMDLDPMLKIKRDVLVTVYSILVLTVFLSLSFPDLLILQS